MTDDDLNQQTFIWGGTNKPLPFKGIDRIDAYFHESKEEVVWNNDQ